MPKEEVKTWIPYPGGAPANVAAALGRLGVKVSFISAVGQDELGENMLELLSCKQFDSQHQLRSLVGHMLISHCIASLQLGMWIWDLYRGCLSLLETSWSPGTRAGNGSFLDLGLPKTMSMRTASLMERRCLRPQSRYI